MKIKAYKSAARAARALNESTPTVFFAGACRELLDFLPNDSIDLTITSPPYCMGKAYETSQSVEDFIKAHKAILPEIVRITRPGGSICWQVGYHVSKVRTFPLDYPIFEILSNFPEVVLRNRIVWTFAHGLHGNSRFSGRHETILWFTKGSDHFFNLDAVRVPQKYPGKRHYKGPRKGQYSCNPNGKNPGDVWDIPNVKSNHVEKLDHPCQFPVALAERLVRGLCPNDGIVFDPFAGSASTGVAAIMNGKRFLGAEIDSKYSNLACMRLTSAHNGTVPLRPLDQPIYVPNGRESVAKRPEHFKEIFS